FPLILLPILVNDVRWVGVNELARPNIKAAFLLLFSICPFCVVLGSLTPRLVDEFAGGSPAHAGKAYATNVLGCILGPLVACYLLMPTLPERYSLIITAAPLLVFCFNARADAQSI